MRYSSGALIATAALCLLGGCADGGVRGGRLPTAARPVPEAILSLDEGGSEAAREPFDRGLAAAGQQDWSGALASLLEAQADDPYAPQILFNLGLVTAHLPGYEIRSVAWLQAYLMVAPNAPNAGAVRAEIAAQEGAFEARHEKVLARIADMMADAKSHIDEIGRLSGDATWQYRKYYVLSGGVGQLAVADYYFGDTAASRRALDLAVGLLDDALRMTPETADRDLFSSERFRFAGGASPPPVIAEAQDEIQKTVAQTDIERLNDLIAAARDGAARIPGGETAIPAFLEARYQAFIADPTTVASEVSDLGWVEWVTMQFYRRVRGDGPT